jgi:hypothetical protein
MSLMIFRNTANARPATIQSGGTTTMSIAATSTPTPVRAMARFVIDAAAPFFFGHGSKEAHSDLVLIGPAGTTIDSTNQIVSMDGSRGLVPITIFVGERDMNGALIGREELAGIDVNVQ